MRRKPPALWTASSRSWGGRWGLKDPRCWQLRIFWAISQASLITQVITLTFKRAQKRQTLSIHLALLSPFAAFLSNHTINSCVLVPDYKRIVATLQAIWKSEEGKNTQNSITLASLFPNTIKIYHYKPYTSLYFTFKINSILTFILSKSRWKTYKIQKKKYKSFPNSYHPVKLLTLSGFPSSSFSIHILNTE